MTCFKRKNVIPLASAAAGPAGYLPRVSDPGVVYGDVPGAKMGTLAVPTGSKPAQIDPLGDLLAATASGDRHAFARVYQLTASRLFAIALRIVRRRDLAEEVVQDAYLSVWRKAGQYSTDRGQPLAWMTGIVRYRAIDRLRQLGRDTKEVVSLDELAGAGREVAVLQVPDTADLSLGLRNCLGRLQDPQRGAILLAYYYGLTHEELATHLDTPLGTVKSWVRRGLLRLKECLDQ